MHRHDQLYSAVCRLFCSKEKASLLALLAGYEPNVPRFAATWHRVHREGHDQWSRIHSGQNGNVLNTNYKLILPADLPVRTPDQDLPPVPADEWEPGVGAEGDEETPQPVENGRPRERLEGAERDGRRSRAGNGRVQPSKLHQVAGSLRGQFQEGPLEC
eukprot:s1335_g10.t1